MPSLIGLSTWYVLFHLSRGLESRVVPCDFVPSFTGVGILPHILTRLHHKMAEKYHISEVCPLPMGSLLVATRWRQQVVVV